MVLYTSSRKLWAWVSCINARSHAPCTPKFTTFCCMYKWPYINFKSECLLGVEMQNFYTSCKSCKLWDGRSENKLYWPLPLVKGLLTVAPSSIIMVKGRPEKIQLQGACLFMPQKTPVLISCPGTTNQNERLYPSARGPGNARSLTLC